MGGVTGVMVAVLPFDWQAHDTYFIVAHLHYVLIGGMVFPVFGAIYHWAPLINGTPWRERLGALGVRADVHRLHRRVLPDAHLGPLGMPRRVATYAGDLGWNGLNPLSSVGALVFAAGVAAVPHRRDHLGAPEMQTRQSMAGTDTFEWLPNEEIRYAQHRAESTRAIPCGTRPALAREVTDGQHWLPGTATGRSRDARHQPGTRAAVATCCVLPDDSCCPCSRRPAPRRSSCC